MKIRKLKRARHIIYQSQLESELPGTPVHKCSEYEAFRLKIVRRDTDDTSGEANFLIRERKNNLRFLILYCFMDEPGHITHMSFWINTKVPFPSGEIEYAGNLVDPEKSTYLIMDFCENHLKKNHTLG